MLLIQLMPLLMSLLLIGVVVLIIYTVVNLPSTVGRNALDVETADESITISDTEVITPVLPTNDLPVINPLDDDVVWLANKKLITRGAFNDGNKIVVVYSTDTFEVLNPPATVLQYRYNYNLGITASGKYIAIVALSTDVKTGIYYLINNCNVVGTYINGEFYPIGVMSVTCEIGDIVEATMSLDTKAINVRYVHQVYNDLNYDELLASMHYHNTIRRVIHIDMGNWIKIASTKIPVFGNDLVNEQLRYVTLIKLNDGQTIGIVRPTTYVKEKV